MTTKFNNDFQNSGTSSDDSFSSNFSSGKKKTIVDGSEDISAKENPKSLGILTGFLVSFSKTEMGEYWDLREGNNPIGSTEDNTIFLAEKHVSSKHANLNISKDAANGSWKYQLVDLSSTNGTELNGQRLGIYTGVEIKNNDIVKIGEYTLMLISVDKFLHKLSKSDKFKGSTQNSGDDYTGMNWNKGDGTRANY